MKAWWMIAVLMFVGAPTLAKGGGSGMDAQAEQQALGQLFAMAQTQPDPGADQAAQDA